MQITRRWLLLFLSFLASLSIGCETARPKHNTAYKEGYLRMDVCDNRGEILYQSPGTGQVALLFQKANSECIRYNIRAQLYARSQDGNMMDKMNANYDAIQQAISDMRALGADVYYSMTTFDADRRQVAVQFFSCQGGESRGADFVDGVLQPAS